VLYSDIEYIISLRLGQQEKEMPTHEQLAGQNKQSLSMYRNLYNSINGISTFFAFALPLPLPTHAPFTSISPPLTLRFLLVLHPWPVPLQLQTEMEMGNGQAAAASAKRERKKPIYRLELEL